MKTFHTVVLSIFLTSASLIGFCQSSIDNFFRYTGCEIVANMAHPTSTYSSGEWRIYSDRVWVKVRYTDGSYTEVNLNRRGSFFTGVSIVRDTDPWYPLVSPFEAVGLMKDLVMELINEDVDQERLSEFERKVNKTLYEMEGRDLACLALTLEWLDY